ncbi:MAG: M48 family metallopeptidase [Alphaproteobacteria bacterium]|nr:M48 family metallopeptidase [Alphaproteobacteria bacterium]
MTIAKSDGAKLAIPITYRRKVGSKSISIHPNLAARTITVSFPFYVPQKLAEDFVAQKRAWLERTFAANEASIKIADGATIPLFGREYTIMHTARARRGVWLEEDKLFVSGDAQFLNRRVKDFIKAETLARIKSIARAYAKKLDVEIGNISVKEVSSRWGSCASNGNIAFSWRLAFAPPHIMEYIVAHEVAHRVEMNHSYKFWRLVKAHYEGDVEAAKRYLSREGLKLHRID